MDMSEAIARESIRDLVARYNANGDSGRFEQLMELFAPDAVMELEGNQLFEGRDEILTIFTGTQERWSEELNPSGSAPSHHVRHNISTHQIDFDDADHARGYCYYAVIMPHGLDHWGRYFDRYERHDGRWLFARRKVTTEGRTQQQT